MKYEVSKEEKFNPIIQDEAFHNLKNMTLPRYYPIFPFFNYGMIPQTWESSIIKDPTL